MTNFRKDAIAREMRNSEEKGITFEDKMLSWNSAEDVKSVVQALKMNKIVNYLKLDGNTLGVKAAEAIGEALKMHPEMRKALWKNMFTGRLKSEIPIALKHLSKGLMTARAQLTVLDLSDNALGPNGMVGLEDLLRSPVCYTLQDLLLNNCGLGIGGGQMLSAALIDCYNASLKAGTPLKLKTFITGRNRLENDGAKAVAKIFSTIKTLEMIAMPQNSIYAEGMAALAEGIRHNPNLKIINLNDNTMGAQGASAIADALCHTPKLREMNFGDCLLKTDGAYALATVLDEVHHDIEVVDLSFNEIGADGGVALAGVLSNKSNIKRINIDGNQFGEGGRCRIRDIMVTSPNPNVLDDLDEDEDPKSDVEEELLEEEEYGEENEKSSATEKTNGNAEVYDKSDNIIYDGNEEEAEEWEEDGGTETLDEEQEDIYERGNDTTEEVDEEDSQDYNEDDDDSCYAANNPYVKNNTFGSIQLNTNQPAASDEYDEYAAETFCLYRKPCTLEMFEKIPGDKLQEMREIFELMEGDNQTLVMVFAAYKCAHLSKESSEALDVAKRLFLEVFEHASKINQENRVLVHILTHIGLLRSDPSFQPSFNVRNCHLVLEETLKEPTIKSTFIRNTLTTSLAKAKTLYNGN